MIAPSELAPIATIAEAERIPDAKIWHSSHAHDAQLILWHLNRLIVQIKQINVNESSEVSSVAVAARHLRRRICIVDQTLANRFLL